MTTRETNLFEKRTCGVAKLFEKQSVKTTEIFRRKCLVKDLGLLNELNKSASKTLQTKNALILTEQ